MPQARSRRKNPGQSTDFRSTAACPRRTRVRPGQGCDPPGFPRGRCGRSRANRSQSSGGLPEESGSNYAGAVFPCDHHFRPDDSRFRAVNGSNHRSHLGEAGAPCQQTCPRKRRQLTGGAGKSSRLWIVRYCGLGKGFFVGELSLSLFFSGKSLGDGVEQAIYETF